MPRPLAGSRAALLFTLASLAGCASLPENVEREPSHALADPGSTAVGRLVAGHAAEHPGMSGFALVRSGRRAFATRIGMAAIAERTLDLQYYIWEADATGRILAERLARAADRGVRVRILVDDINLAADGVVAALDAHENIEIRVFNPFANRGMKAWDFLTDLDRVNHRMHNKAMVVDNAMAVAGGRNIGNHYFGVHTEANFRDLDLLVAGPLVPRVSATFDHFWNGEWSYPIAVLTERPATKDDLEALRAAIAAGDDREPYPYPLDADVEALGRAIGDDLGALTWAPGVVVADDPAAVDDGGTEVGRIGQALAGKVSTLHGELLVESAYFVLTDAGVEAARALVERGVRVRVLTNSLVSNDVLAAHAGYEKRRKALLEAGVELFELRPDSTPSPIDQSVVTARSKAALHTKAFVFDRESIFVGSFNLDPRSASINTEFGIYVESPALAGELASFMDDGVAPESAYRVVLGGDGDVEWIERRRDGYEIRHETEPHSTFWQRFTADVLKLLPIESQL